MPPASQACPLGLWLTQKPSRLGLLGLLTKARERLHPLMGSGGLGAHLGTRLSSLHSVQLLSEIQTQTLMTELKWTL